jgi:hypothetical protein
MLLAAAALIGLSAAPARALLGDMRMVTGTLALWPQEIDGYRVAVVDGDDADRYFVRVTPTTALARDVAPGVRVAVVGREGPVATEITADSIQPRVALAVVRQHGPWRLVTGIVESVSGSTVTLRSDQGRLFVDMSGVGASSVPVAAGDRVTVVGLTQGSAWLAARGIARDVTPR